LRLGASGAFPADYVPEGEVRLNLYARLSEVANEDEIGDFEDEIADRFGPLPRSVTRLFQLARLKCHCRALKIARLDGGPQAIAASFRADAQITDAPASLSGHELEWRGERLVYLRGSEAADERLSLAADFLARIDAMSG
jgi:transcription-repair coupling factor (superfamily II helicase)